MGRVDSEAEAAVLDDARGVALRHLGVKGHLSLRLRRRVKREIDRIERRPERERGGAWRLLSSSILVFRRPRALHGAS